MNKKYWIILLITMVLLTSCGEKKVEIKEMSFGMMPSDSAMPLVVAEREGYFKEEGIDVNLELFFSAKDRDSAFHTGNINGADYDLVTALMTSNSDFELLVGSASEGSFKFVGTTENPNDIVNKKLGISKNTVKTQMARAYRFLKESLDPKDFYFFCLLQKKQKDKESSIN